MVELLLYGVVQTHGAYILCGWTVVFWGRRANEPVAPVEMFMYIFSAVVQNALKKTRYQCLSQAIYR